MLYTITLIQAAIFLFFLLVERLRPASDLPPPKHFDLWWLALNTFSMLWAQVAFFAWIDLDGVGLKLALSPIAQGFTLYILYSFINYWIHRFKHSNKFLWEKVHRLHHSPSNMVTKIAFYRHPLEIALNTLVIFIFGKVVFDISFEVMALVLTIEGSLECFHHSNIRTPPKLRWLGYIIQVPEMHLAHHEYGKHQSNYAPFLWDTIFGTRCTPRHKISQLGFKNSNNVAPYIFLKKGS